jgi:signal transduction histidine kinase/HAMP domain-containing protein
MSFEWWLSGTPQLPLLSAQIVWTALLAVGFAYSIAQTWPTSLRLSIRTLTFSIVSFCVALLAGGAGILRMNQVGPATIAGLPATPYYPVAGIFLVAWLIVVAVFGGGMQAILAGLAAGLVRSVWGTHQVATILEYAWMGWLLVVILRQNYVGLLFSILRRPWVGAVVAGAIILLLRFGGDASSASGDLVSIFEYALSRLPAQAAAVGLECAFGGLLAETIRLVLHRNWPTPKSLRPTLYQQSIAWKLGLWLALPLVVMAVTLTGTVILEAHYQARVTLERKSRDTAAIVRNNLPVALTIGHSIAEEIAAGAPLATADKITWQTYLETKLGRPPFFSELGFFSPQNGPMKVYPRNADPMCQNAEESKGCALALQGMAWDGWIVAGTPTSVWISFAQPVKDTSGRIVGALIGRTSLETNPMLMAIPKAFDSLDGGRGVLLDIDGRVVYPLHTNMWIDSTRLRLDADGGQWSQGEVVGGGKTLDYLLPLGYPDMEVGIQMPESLAIQTALENGLPVGFMALVAIFLTEALVLLIARQIILPLRRLVISAGQIAAGDWERSIQSTGDDEIGLLGAALETMRKNLRRQMQQQELLLRAGQTMTTSQDLTQLANVLLRSAKTASLTAGGLRLALIPAIRKSVLEKSLTSGEWGPALAGIDNDALDRVSRTAIWTGNRSVATEDAIWKHMPEKIRGIVILRIARGSTVFGALCIAFSERQAFEMGMLDGLSGLANQAALAISNLAVLETTEGERQRLASILDAVPEGVAVTDADGRLLYANTAFAGMLGIPSISFDRPLGETIRDAALADFILQQSVQPNSRDVSGANSAALQAVVRSVRSADGAAVWQVCVLQDVSRLRQLDDMKSEFVHTVSHDLRRPLTTIDGLANMMEMMGPLNPAQKEYALRIRQAAQNMQRLVTDLLDIGRMEQGAGVKRSPVSIPALLRQVMEEWKSEAASSGISLSLEIPEALPDLLADSSLLERAVGNLVENALRFNRTEGAVQVLAFRTESDLIISVRDTGLGIAPADQPRVYEKFFRGAAKENQDRPAWGLGLAIVKQVTDWHHGKTWFDTQLGQGSTFYIALPIRS